MKTKHTPGSWYVAKDGYGRRRVFGSDNKRVASCTKEATKKSEEEFIANMHLIAAAPDLLNAAIAALDVLDDINEEHTGLRNNPGWVTLDNLRAAIAKALG